MTWIVVGRFGKANGLKGYIRVQSFTEPYENILHYPQWFMQVDKQWRLIEVESKQAKGTHILAKVKGVNDRTAVMAFTNCDIAIKETDLPELVDGEYYWKDIIGLTVKNASGIRLGIVKDLMETGSNDVLIVQGEKEYLIPYLPERFVLDVDQKSRTITVDWDENF
jgi:16S rRNA processing protein RimM